MLGGDLERVAVVELQVRVDLKAQVGFDCLTQRLKQMLQIVSDSGVVNT